MVYTADYLAKWEVLNEMEKDRGKALARKRELMNQGYEVHVKKWDFTDLAREIVWSIEARRERR